VCMGCVCVKERQRKVNENCKITGILLNKILLSIRILAD
jgi:hypothetical protein